MKNSRELLRKTAVDGKSPGMNEDFTFAEIFQQAAILGILNILGCILQRGGDFLNGINIVRAHAEEDL